jgi:two-component system chemotaxis sensor kinase CheA
MSTDEEFQEWLLATFREEADEILTGISNGLIELEKSGPTPGSELIEQVYRKTHSLKGAARAVNFRDIESVCQNIENIFFLMKTGGLNADDTVFDLLHQAITTIYATLAETTGSHTGCGEIIRELRLLSDSAISEKNTLLNNLDHRKDALQPSQTAYASSQSSLKYSPPITTTGQNEEVQGVKTRKKNQALSDSEQRLPVSPEEKHDPLLHSGNDQIPSQIPGGGTVRIAAHKLDRLISSSEDLLTTRLFIDHRLNELDDMLSRFSLWRWNHSQIEGDIHQIREVLHGIRKNTLPYDLLLPLERIIGFLKFDRDFVLGMQHDLGFHMQATEIDRSALEASTSEISDLIHDAVLIPVSSIFSTFSKFVREYARSIGKKVDFHIEGKDIEMDRRILETIKPSLMHIIHNSIDHGIEYPDIRIQQDKPPEGSLITRITTHSGSKVAIEITDDGAGIDCTMIRRTAREKGVISHKEEMNITDDEVLWLIFRSGFSTKSEVADLSGRGLGLAIVDDTVTRLGGELMVSSEVSKGTSITIILPVRLATLRGMVVRCGSQNYIFPIQQIRKVIRADPESFITQGNRIIIRIENENIRVIQLSDLLGMAHIPSFTGNEQHIPVIIFEYAGRQIACVVDEIFRVQEIVVRPLGNLLRRVNRITGAVLFGDGSTALVLDPLDIIQESFMSSRQLFAPFAVKRLETRILVVDDSATSRALIRRTLETAGFQVQTACDGMDALLKLRSYEIHLIISDVDMPRMNGYNLTEKVRGDERFSHIPILLVTSLDSEQDREYGKTIGADGYIIKSQFEKKLLLESVNNLLYKY